MIGCGVHFTDIHVYEYSRIYSVPALADFISSSLNPERSTGLLSGYDRLKLGGVKGMMACTGVVISLELS